MKWYSLHRLWAWLIPFPIQVRLYKKLADNSVIYHDDKHVIVILEKTVNR